ncbi:alpha/beta fold hydrolase [Streptomyces sp. NPDC087844]|uniref:alpha/beta fold hydrolase n=1 Tax=Streptomyces sp. NPDC087844 TaxID=3365805 RepID=UPI00382A544F
MRQRPDDSSRLFRSSRLFHTVEGEGPSTVLLVHGEAGDSDDWAPQLEALGAQHRLIAPDLPGHGRSPAARHGHTPRDLADDLAGLLAALDTPSVIAVGHAAGAAIASVLAVERPDLVRALVAVNPRYGLHPQHAAAMAAAVRVPDPAAALARSLAAEEGGAAGEPTSWLPAWHRRRALTTDGDVLVRMLTALYHPSTGPAVRPVADAYLSRRTCPVLTVCSRRWAEARNTGPDWDRSVGSHSAGDSVLWDGVGHWPHQERFDDFNALVLDWTGRLPVTGAVARSPVPLRHPVPL